MNIAKQLYQLQGVDLELESREKALQQLVSQLGESQAVIDARNKLTSEQQRLEELKRQQHSTEWEIDDLTDKLTTMEKKLYNGNIRNPKELTNLQHEVNELKANRRLLEDKTLEIMEQVELALASVAATTGELKRLEAEWHSQQQQLSTEIEQLKSALSDLEQERQLFSAEIDPRVIKSYHELRRQKRTAVAKVEQGVCSGCRISLPITEVQQARSGTLVQCSRCGRILFLA